MLWSSQIHHSLWWMSTSIVFEKMTNIQLPHSVCWMKSDFITFVPYAAMYVSLHLLSNPVCTFKVLSLSHLTKLLLFTLVQFLTLPHPCTVSLRIKLLNRCFPCSVCKIYDFGLFSFIWQYLTSYFFLSFYLLSTLLSIIYPFSYSLHHLQKLLLLICFHYSWLKKKK